MAEGNQHAGKGKSVDESFIQRVARGFNVVMGKEPKENAFFSPLEPIKPMAQETAYARAFDFQSGYNIKTNPRADESIDFKTLRNLADGYDLMRLAIETRKDQMAKMKFTVKPIDPKQEIDKRCEEVIAFLRFPNKQHDWNTWQRAILEDMLVLDAVTILPRKTKGGKMYALDLIDGATIKVVIDEQGRTPMPPHPAYQQVLKGLPAVDYTCEELVYAPRNVRTHKVYGYSPVEQIIMTVNIALRHQVTQLQYFTEGNVPEALISTPAGWTPEQIAQYQTYWDMIIEGDISQKRKAKFIPDGMKLQMVRSDINKSEFDEWLARLVCYAFSISPSALIRDQNRSTSETQAQLAKEEGLAPLMVWQEGVMTRIIHQHFGYTDLEFKFEEEEAQDPLVQAQVNEIYVRSGIKTPNEVRAEIGLDPINDEDANMTIDQKTRRAQESAAAAMEQQNLNDPNADDEEEPEDKEKEKKEDEQEREDKEKFAKAKKKIVSINHTRASIVRLEKRLDGLVTKMLKEAKQSAVNYVKNTPMKKADGIDALIEQYLGDWIFNFDDFEGSVYALLARIGRDGAGVATDALINAGVQITHTISSEMAQLAKEAAEQRAGWLITNIDTATRNMIATDVAMALEEGKSVAELAKVLEESYAFDKERSKMIATTETAYADVSGNMSAYKAAGVEKKRWILGDDACDDCVNNANQGAIPFDDVFSDGSSQAPAHPNCRCDIVPVLD